MDEFKRAIWATLTCFIEVSYRLEIMANKITTVDGNDNYTISERRIKRRNGREGEEEGRGKKEGERDGEWEREGGKRERWKKEGERGEGRKREGGKQEGGR